MNQNTYNITLDPIQTDKADAAQKALLEHSQRTLGMVPNMYANMVNLPPLLETYQFGYSKFREEGGFNPVEQEIVLLTISACNDCHYCKAAHGFLAANNANFPEEEIEHILEHQTLSDSKLDQLCQFTRLMCEQRGNPTEEQARAFLDAGFTEKHILSIILAISVKVISNYANHIFHTPVDSMFQG